MNIVKFECPSCGQQMECDRSRSGDVIHCVDCCAELRIPFSSAKTGLTSIERAELIIPGAAPSAPLPGDLPPSPGAHAARVPEDARNSPSESLEATCPVCQAHLRLDPHRCSHGTHENPPPTAELVHHNQLSAHAHPAPAPHTSPSSVQTAGQPATINHPHLSFEERERQIAEGRKAHPIQTNPAQKPRLDYILSGGATPPSKGPS